MSSTDQEYNGIECRICHSKTVNDLILSPCLCKGSMAYVHFRCLECWLNYASRDSCELCSYRFNLVLTRRYTFLQSICVWTRHPTTRAFILCDVAICLVLTLLTLALIAVCVVGLNHFADENNARGIQTLWSKSIIDCFLMILLIGYFVILFSMAKDHIRPWYSWWIHCNNVRLVLDENTIFTIPLKKSEQTLMAGGTAEACKERSIIDCEKIISEQEVICIDHEQSEHWCGKRVEITSNSVEGEFENEQSNNRNSADLSNSVDECLSTTLQGKLKVEII